MTRWVLRPVESTDDWAAYHEIRRRILFERRGRVGVYREDHPDEFASNNHPMVFCRDDEVIGVIRIDLTPPQAAFRLVAIIENYQGQGHGRVLEDLAERFAFVNGAHELVLNAAPEAVGFYERLGFVVAPPDEFPGHPRMKKGLTTPAASPI